MPLYPKLSNQAIVRSEGFDPYVPSPLGQAFNRRMREQEQADYKAQDMKLSPLDRAVAGLESAMMMGSMMFEAIQQAPKLLQGEDAYATAIGNRVYQPRFQPEKSAEYIGNVIDLMEKAQTEYKIPPLLPEVAGFAPLMQATNQQVKQGVDQAATNAGMALERSLEKPVTNIMNRGGFGAQMLGSFNTNPVQVIKNKGGNWLGGNLAGGVDKRLKSLKTQDRQVSPLFLEDWRQDVKNPSIRGLSDEELAMTERRLNEHDAENAVNQWIESNVGNYVKKEMGTPEDPVRLMLEKRAQEIEAQYQVDMNRAQRTRAKAEVETDPNKRANLMRRAEQQESEAKTNRDFSNEYATHLPKDEYYDEDALDDLQDKRKAQGFPLQGMAKSEPAKQWENISDEAIDITRAGDIQKQQAMSEQSKEANLAFDKLFNQIDETYSVRFRNDLEKSGVTLDDQQFMNIIKSTPITDKANYLGLGDQFKKLRQESFNADKMFSSGLQEMGEENPFVSKLDPETKLYSGYLGDLGIDHVVDVIKQDVAAGRIRPDQLNKLSMDQAIKRTAEYNRELAEKMNATRAAAREGLPVYKEYPEGYRWIELNKPGSFNAESEAMGHSVKGYEPPKGHPDWVEGSGDYGSLGYGYGGWEGIKSGRAKVYSLVNQKGEPHVTVEVTKPQVRTEPEEMQKIYDQAVQEANERNLNTHAEFNGFYYDRVKELQDNLINRKQANASNVITQIKGKGNAAPNEDYLPFVQDFVRSGEWSDVGDLKNTGLHDVQGKYYTEEELTEAAKKYGRMGVMDTPWEVARQSHMDAGISEEDALANWVDAFKEGRGRLDIPPEGQGMKAGGKVHVSDNPDTMMTEMEDQHFGVGGAAIKRVMKIADPAQRAFQANKLVEKMFQSGNLNEEYLRLLHKAQTGARSLPEVIPRARPRTKDEIRGYAQQTADQLNAVQQGKFLRASPEKSENFAGKSFDQWKMEQDLQHDIRPTGVELQTPEVADIAKQKGMLKLGISGDTTIADKNLYQAGDYKLKFPSEQQGGPFYGLRKRANPVSWASNEQVLQGQQRDINAFSEAYGGVPVIGQFNAMGPVGTNFAQHFAGANLNAIDITKMSPAQLDDFNELIRRGSKKSGVHHDFPGIEDPSAYTYLGFYPELRKHFNSLMVKPTTTEKYGLPDGRVILHAITEPELRDMPVLTSGHSQFELVTGHDPKSLPLSGHSTYSHDLPMKPDTTVKQTPFPIPAELEFSDVKEYAEPLYQPSEMTRVYQTSSPRQIIDQQHIDEVKQYEDFMRQYTPQSEKKKDGGLIKIKSKRKAGKKVVEVKKAIGGEITGDDLILTERPL